MSIEDLLRRSANEVAGSLDPPGPDLTAIHRGARNGRRQRITVVAAAAATAAVLAAVSLPSGDGRPAPAPPPEEDEVVVVPSRPVWADHDGVHVGDRTYAPADGGRVVLLTLVADGVVYSDDHSRVWFQPRRGSAVEIGHQDGDSLHADADGTTAAWFEATDSGQDLVVYDTATRSELARSAAPAPLYPLNRSGMNGEHVANQGHIALVDDDSVVYGARDGVRSYDPATDTHEVIEPHDPGDPATGAVSMFVDFATDARARVDMEMRQDDVISFLEDDDTVISTVEGLENTGTFNRDGSTFAGIADEHVVVSIDTATGEARPLTPRTDQYPLIGWGYGDMLMVIHVDVDTDPFTYTLRQCDTGTGECAVVPFRGSQVGPCDTRSRECAAIPFRGSPVIPSS